MKKPIRAKVESAAAKAASPAASTPATNPWDHWWNHSPFMVKDAYGHYAAKPGAEFWYDNFWKPRMPSAWAYELVRRLSVLKLKQPKITAKDREWLQTLPPVSSIDLDAEESAVCGSGQSVPGALARRYVGHDRFLAAGPVFQTR